MTRIGALSSYKTNNSWVKKSAKPANSGHIKKIVQLQKKILRDMENLTHRTQSKDKKFFKKTIRFLNEFFDLDLKFLKVISDTVDTFRGYKNSNLELQAQERANGLLHKAQLHNEALVRNEDDLRNDLKHRADSHLQTSNVFLDSIKTEIQIMKNLRNRHLLENVYRHGSQYRDVMYEEISSLRKL